MRRVAVLAVLVAAALVTPAGAKRPATAQERAAIAASRELPVECVAAEVSTVDPTWATFTGTGYDLDQCGDRLGDGVALMRSAAGAWQTVAEGSESLGPCEALGVPLAVGRDLTVAGSAICRRRETYILCLPTGSMDRVHRSRPRRCTTLGPRDSFSQAANLTNLRWRSWGRPVATARGIERGFHLPLSRIPVRVRAYGRRVGCGGDYVYTRLRATSRYGRLVVRFPRGCSA